MSPGLRPASGQGSPSNRRTGRRFTYRSKKRRKSISRPQTAMWSGTSAGLPTAPKYTASNCRRIWGASSGHMRPCCWYQSQLHGNSWNLRPIPCFAPTASSTRTPSGMTSRPMPSPGMTAMRCSLMADGPPLMRSAWERRRRVSPYHDPCEGSRQPEPGVRDEATSLRRDSGDRRRAAAREPLLQALEVEVDHRREIERQHLRHHEPTDDRKAERATRVTARAEPDRDRET